MKVYSSDSTKPTQRLPALPPPSSPENLPPLLEESPPRIRLVSPRRPRPSDIALPPSPTLSYTSFDSEVSPIPARPTFPLLPQPLVFNPASTAAPARASKKYLPPPVNKKRFSKLRKVGSLKETLGKGAHRLARAGSKLFEGMKLKRARKPVLENDLGIILSESGDWEELEWETEGGGLAQDTNGRRRIALGSAYGKRVVSGSSKLQPRSAGRVRDPWSGATYSRIPRLSTAQSSHSRTHDTLTPSQTPHRRRSSGVSQRRTSDASHRRSSAVFHRRRSSGSGVPQPPSSSIPQTPFSSIPRPRKIFPTSSPEKAVSKLSLRIENKISRGRPVKQRRGIAEGMEESQSSLRGSGKKATIETDEESSRSSRAPPSSLRRTPITSTSRLSSPPSPIASTFEYRQFTQEPTDPTSSTASTPISSHPYLAYSPPSQGHVTYIPPPRHPLSTFAPRTPFASPSSSNRPFSPFTPSPTPTSRTRAPRSLLAPPRRLQKLSPTSSVDSDTTIKASRSPDLVLSYYAHDRSFGYEEDIASRSPRKEAFDEEEIGENPFVDDGRFDDAPWNSFGRGSLYEISEGGESSGGEDDGERHSEETDEAVFAQATRVVVQVRRTTPSLHILSDARLSPAREDEEEQYEDAEEEFRCPPLNVRLRKTERVGTPCLVGEHEPNEKKYSCPPLNIRPRLDTTTNETQYPSLDALIPYPTLLPNHADITTSPNPWTELPLPPLPLTRARRPLPPLPTTPSRSTKILRHPLMDLPSCTSSPSLGEVSGPPWMRSEGERLQAEGEENVSLERGW